MNPLFNKLTIKLFEEWRAEHKHSISLQNFMTRRLKKSFDNYKQKQDMLKGLGKEDLNGIASYISPFILHNVWELKRENK